MKSREMREKKERRSERRTEEDGGGRKRERRNLFEVLGSNLQVQRTISNTDLF